VLNSPIWDYIFSLLKMIIGFSFFSQLSGQKCDIIWVFASFSIIFDYL